MVEGSKPAAAEAPALAQSVDQSATIVMRLWRAELDIGMVEKAETAVVKMEGGGQYTYKFTGYDAVIAAVRPALARHGIKVWPTTAEHSRNGNLTVTTVSVEFINVDQPSDRMSVSMTNYGADKGDKGASKALTNAVREAIKKALGITSKEDDRADETTEYESDEGTSRGDANKLKEQRRAAIEQWAKAAKMALEKATSRKDISRLQRENRDQLASEDLPEVTRTFFVELIQKRMADLPE